MNDHRQHEEVLQRGLKRIQAQTPEQRRAFLQHIGILNEQGQLAERYRAPDEPSQPTEQASR